MKATAFWLKLLMVSSEQSIFLCKPKDLSWVTGTYSTPQTCPLTAMCILPHITHMHINGDALKLPFKPTDWETQDSPVELDRKLEEATSGSRSLEVTLSWLLKLIPVLSQNWGD